MTISTFCRGETSIAFTWAKIPKQLTYKHVFICFVFFSFISGLNVEDCATNSQLCNRNAVCKTMEGSSICICNPGYSGNGKICTGNHNITNIPIRVVLIINVLYSWLIFYCVCDRLFFHLSGHARLPAYSSFIFVYRLIYVGLVYFLMGVCILMIF